MNPANSVQASEWRILKFGGSSVARPDNWPHIVEQVRLATEQGLNVAVVVSALRGITDLLQAHIETAQAGNHGELFAEVDRRHHDMLTACGLPETTLDKPLADLRHFLAQEFDIHSPADQARLLAFGEVLSSRLAIARLGLDDVPAAWLDSRKVLITDEPKDRGRRARYLSARCRPTANPELAGELAQESRVWVMPGFVAANPAGETVLLGRGGSDTSATVLAAVLGARRVDIFSDVPGLFSADPRRVSGARLLKQVGFREAQELAAMGAKALHPAALIPAHEQGIEIHMRQTGRPDIEGTVITSTAQEHGAQVKAIVQRKPITLISLEDIGMWQQVGFLAAVFDVFRQLGLSVDQVSTSESNVTLTLDPGANVADQAVLDELVRELGKLCRVEVLTDCATVSLVGLGIRTILHRLGPALEVFEQRRIFQVSQAANDLNLTFVVESRHAERLVQQLHQQVIPGGVGGDSVFGPTFEQLFRDETAPVYVPPWWQHRRDELLQLMAGHGSAYVYDLPTVREACRRLSGLQSVDRVLYSMKANSHPQLLRTAVAGGLGVECVSLAEARHALEQVPDLEPGDMLFTPNFAPREEYRQAVAMGLPLTVDNMHVLEHWGRDLAGQSIFLRLDPGSGLGHHKLVRTAGSNSKFGIPLSELERAQTLCRAHDIRIRGLHAHTGSGIMHPDNWHRSLETLGEAARRIDTVEIINLGGGLGVPDRSDELPLDTTAMDGGLAELKKQLPRSVQVWIEPGRYVVSPAGVLLARVTQTKDKDSVRYVGVATGMNSLIRPALYGAWHEIVNLSRFDEPGSHVYNVVGPICESGDILGLDRLLPHSSEGDVLLIANTGAYGAAMASRYNLREPAGEIVLD
ncbi:MULTISPECIES: bifunctional aspartate kinase/diaminopimelate decarboxylase [unclassified Wenzhouxiangella]|uniref:bifunctional aspartate kinase/diaminopimelate decarboxylase n=1 Tax=unclassified Wenzhouxiangella TaxID=2613841 RepID=UPI000E32BAB4|nr:MULTISPECIES: bifunctional aspartate kinase/diaminopimelate decarboxylase [unclassified Wenzhouxiangella]RFF28483.1 bifunctional aspartate kinase/diaminopimelate decarboxylase [Wenzhouxiangella sp. 15181]RFP70001.1 bifunctional aspartate kinase/diaminopimelate decarboxylase [Wenzhouxiangella sp. 15190]